MPRFHQITFAVIGLATFSFTGAAHSAEPSTTQRATIATKHKDAGLSQKGIIIVGGKNQTGSDRMLNPQPLPPKDAGLSHKGIIIVGGKSSERAHSAVPSAMDRLAGGPTLAAAGTKAGPGVNPRRDKNLDMIQLQSLMSQRQQALQMTTNMINKMSESSNTVARNLR
jgi:hypothetical protein